MKKTYTLGKVPVNVLRGVKLKVETGKFLAFVEPSGNGKSTLLNLIGALDKPTKKKCSSINPDSLQNDKNFNQKITQKFKPDNVQVLYIPPAPPTGFNMLLCIPLLIRVIEPAC